LPADTLPGATGPLLPELVAGAGDDVTTLDEDELATTLVLLLEEVELLTALLQGFQVVTTQSWAVPVVAVPVVAVPVLAVLVTDVELLAVVAPTATRQTLPVTPALRHAAVSLTNRRYSVADAVALPIANKHNPKIHPPTGIKGFFKVENIYNLLVLKISEQQLWHVCSPVTVNKTI
jgi:hypothetical protein